jgi:hypothetical protein
MIDEEHALMGLGSCGMVAIVNVLRREIVSELNMGL